MPGHHDNLKYKLTYFDLRGLAECARMILAYAEIPYEDHRVPLKEDDYKSQKNQPNTPFGQLPILEVDGQKLAQSSAINRYLARQYGLVGQTPFEEAQVDSISDAFKDFMMETRPYFIAAFGFTNEDKDQLYAEKLHPAKEKFFTAMNEFLRKSGSGYLVGDKVTWADLFIAERLQCFVEYAPKLFEGHQEIHKWTHEILEIPQIKKWMDMRPDNRF